MADAELPEEELERPKGLPSAVGADDADTVVRRADVRVDDFSQHRCGIALALEEGYHLEPRRVANA